MKPPVKLALARPTQALSKVARELEERDVQFHVRLSPRLHRAMKMRALERGQTIREYVLELLRRDGLELGKDGIE